MASSEFARRLILLLLVIPAMTEGRTLPRRHGSHHRHGHHHRSELIDLEDYPSRHLSHNHLEKPIETSSFDLEQREFEATKFAAIETGDLEFDGRRKRHNAKRANVRYEKMTEEDRRDYGNSVQREIERIGTVGSARNKRYDDNFELEVREAQNSSVCNYTVVSIPDTRGNRIPKDLQHVMCNHAGSRCQALGTYCCIQTYRYVDVAYTDNFSENMKIYVGCVCSLQRYDELEPPKLRLDD